MAEITRTVNALPKGTALSRFLMALSQKDILHAHAAAEANWRTTPQVAATLRAMIDPGGLTTDWGAPLASFGIGHEIIEALHPQTIVDRAAGSMRKVSFHAKTARET